MKKLKLKMQELNSPEVLTRQQLKNVLGGTTPVTTVMCGVKVNGNWHPSGQSFSGTQAMLGQAITGTDNTAWWSNDGGSVYVNGAYSGTVTNWCCSSCDWTPSVVV